MLGIQSDQERYKLLEAIVTRLILPFGEPAVLPRGVAKKTNSDGEGPKKRAK